MARTRDFLDDMAEWYALPDSPTKAGSRALGLPPLSAPALGLERFWSSARRALAAILELPFVWRERARQRRALLRMSDRMMDDIGISRSEALAEAAKPFWRA